MICSGRPAVRSAQVLVWDGEDAIGKRRSSVTVLTEVTPPSSSLPSTTRFAASRTGRVSDPRGIWVRLIGARAGIGRRSCEVWPQCRRRDRDLGECPDCGCLDADVIESGAASRFCGYPRIRSARASRQVTPEVASRPAAQQPHTYATLAAHSAE